MLPYRSIEQAEKVETPISQEMITALDTWHSMYLDKADWLDDDSVHSLNLAAMIACEEARQILLEMKVSITAPLEDEAEAPEDGSDPMNKRAQFLADEFEKRYVNQGYDENRSIFENSPCGLIGSYLPSASYIFATTLNLGNSCEYKSTNSSISTDTMLLLSHIGMVIHHM